MRGCQAWCWAMIYFFRPAQCSASRSDVNRDLPFAARDVHLLYAAALSLTYHFMPSFSFSPTDEFPTAIARHRVRWQTAQQMNFRRFVRRIVRQQKQSHITAFASRKDSDITRFCQYIALPNAESSAGIHNRRTTGNRRGVFHHRESGNAPQTHLPVRRATNNTFARK